MPRVTLGALVAALLPLLVTTPGSAAPATASGAGAGHASATIRPAVWPLSPRPAVVRAFSPPLSRYGAGHRGVDLAGTEGQRVLAAVPGRVTYAGLLAGRGVVVVDHGATRTTYEPVTAGVAVGAQVAAGDVLGTLTASASHCSPGACLHWGLIEGDVYRDPLSLVGAGPVRLLPLPVPRSVTQHGGAPAPGPSRDLSSAARSATAAIPAPSWSDRPRGSSDRTSHRGPGLMLPV